MINDRELLRLIDKEGLSQSETARRLGISRQAVSKRLIELRGRTTRAVVAKKTEAIVQRKMDSIQQLQKINDHANWILDRVMAWLQGDTEAILDLESSSHWIPDPRIRDPHDIAFKAMAEIRSQNELQLRIFQTIYSLQAAEEFQNTVLEVIGEVDPDVRREILHRLNQRRAARGAIRFS